MERLTHIDRKCMKIIGVLIALLIAVVWAEWGFSGTVGKNTIGTNQRTDYVTGRGFALVETTSGSYVYTASSGDAVTKFWWYGNWGADATNLTIRMAIYDVVGGIPQNRVGSEATITVSSGTDQWWGSSTVNIPLTAGTKYCVAWTVSGGTHSNVTYSTGSTTGDSTSQHSTLNGGPMPATWTNSGIIDIMLSAYADVTNSGTGAKKVIGKAKLGKVKM